MTAIFLLFLGFGADIVVLCVCLLCSFLHIIYDFILNISVGKQTM